MDHHPDFAGVAIDLHLDEVVAAAHRTELRHYLAVGAIDVVELDVVRYFDDLALAKIRRNADRLGAVAQDFVALLLREARHVAGAMRTHAGRDARFDLGDPALALAPIRDLLGAETGHAHVERAARDVVAGAGL